MKYTDKQIESLLTAIYDGRISRGNLPEDLYYAIGEYLERGVIEGLGGVGAVTKFTGSKAELAASLRENVWLFSGAKTFQTVSALEGLLTDDEGVRSFKDFKEFARKEYDLYNDTWAKAEYDTAIGQAQNAITWNNIEETKDVLPLLRYSAIIDQNTSDICEPLNGITLPVDDPFWDVYMPENHYNCRCTVEQLTDGELTNKETLKDIHETVGKEMNSAFKMNPGKTGQVFSNEHPYFDVPKEFKKDAENNFGLPIPDENE